MVYKKIMKSEETKSASDIKGRFWKYSSLSTRVFINLKYSISFDKVKKKGGGVEYLCPNYHSDLFVYLVRLSKISR